MQAANLLGQLCDAGLLADIDRQFALLMAELAAADDIALPAALASAAQRAGHTCLPISECAGRRLRELRHWLPMGAGAEAAMDGAAASARLPSNLGALLGESPLVAHGPTPELRPLVLDAGHLYLHRLFVAERAVAERLRALASSEDKPPGDLPAISAALFANAGPPALQAARTMATRRLCVVTGGPGTGKTTLAARLIALLVALNLATPRRIALAAPTGKAAARLQESLTRQLGGLASTVPALRTFVPQTATVHRLLQRGGLPSPIDALLIDECSMVDLSLMKRVADALPPHARLILLGDAAQLGSVQPGCVFGDIIDAGSAPSSPLSPCVVRLAQSHRFGPRSGLGSLAEAIVEGDAARTLAVLRGADHADVELRPLADFDAFDALAERYAVERCAPLLRRWRERDGCAPVDDLSAFPALRVLCAHRLGPFGAERFNQRVEQRLQSANLVPEDEEFYLGRPVIVTPQRSLERAVQRRHRRRRRRRRRLSASLVSGPAEPRRRRRAVSDPAPAAAAAREFLRTDRASRPGFRVRRSGVRARTGRFAGEQPRAALHRGDARPGARSPSTRTRAAYRPAYAEPSPEPAAWRTDFELVLARTVKLADGLRGEARQTTACGFSTGPRR